ncbi:MAG: hypothetical protein Q7S28_01180 [bacterium]|nr:hypothetical protein [bacterium]
MMCFVALLGFTFIMPVAPTQRPLPTMVVQNVADQALSDGLIAFYNGDYSAAERQFNLYIALRPDDPIGYWRKATNNYVRYYETQKVETPKLTDAEYAFEEALLKTGGSCAMRDMARGGDASLDRYIVAQLFSIKAIYQLGRRSYVTAISTIKMAYSLAGNSTYQDAKHLLAAINYRGAAHPFLTSFAGLPNSREDGMRFLMEAEVGNKGIFADDIKFAVFNLRLERERERAAGKLDRSTQGDILDAAYPLDTLVAELFAKYPRNRDLIAYLSQKH